ncbi:hypothetical protein LXL04_024047 [Taraxacum kok-saghyz]
MEIDTMAGHSEVNIQRGLCYNTKVFGGSSYYENTLPWERPRKLRISFTAVYLCDLDLFSSLYHRLQLHAMVTPSAITSHNSGEPGAFSA